MSALYLNGGPHWKDGVCVRCGKPLAMSEAVWLNFDQSILEYHDFGSIPEGKNQGAFQFGAGCARSLRKRAKIARRAALAKVQP